MHRSGRQRDADAAHQRLPVNLFGADSRLLRRQYIGWRDSTGDDQEEQGVKILTDLDTHHREVIVGLGTVAIGLYFLLQRFYHLTGVFKVGTSQDFEQTIIAELLLLRILCLIKTVGIDKQQTILNAIDFFALILQFRPQADGRIGYHLKEIAMMIATNYYWGIMTSIAVVKMSRLQIHQSKITKKNYSPKYFSLFIRMVKGKLYLT